MRYKGRHRKPSNTGKTIARVAAAGVVMAAPLPLAGIAEASTSSPVDQLANLLKCESGGNPAAGVINWTAKNSTSSASGGFQILDGTWRAYGGAVFAPTARQATPQQQTIVAVRIAAAGGVGQWSCAGKAGFTNPDAISWENVLRLLGDKEVPAAPKVAPPKVKPAPPKVVTPPPVAEMKIPPKVETPAPPKVSAPVPGVGNHYQVKPGDTLSDISLDQIKELDWKPLYERNRAVVGDNPNLILPGQDLYLSPVDSPRVAVPPVTPAPAPAVEKLAEKPAAKVVPSPVKRTDHVQMVDGTRVSQGFSSSHHGIDIPAPIGTKILAPLAGKVISSGPASGFGLWVRLQHADGTITVYGHINQSFVKVGQTVAAGQLIAETGNRGQSTGPHLHFEVQTSGGSAIDPRPWLNARGVDIL